MVRIVRRSAAVLLISTIVVAAMPGPVFAQAAAAAKASANAELTVAPRKLIDETAVKIVAILARKSDTTEKRVAEIEAIAYELFDFTTMSKLVLARNWRKLTTDQRTTFVREFKRHLSHTYGTRLDRYDQERVDVYAAQVEQRDDVTVKTRIVGGQFDGAEVSYRLRKQADKWRIIDVVIEGVSLVSNYRSQFQEVLNTGTIDDLLAKLRDKNFKVDEPKTTAKQG
ncbi:ABC transporter substrate-binding protein [Myxococcota bacterium]|nr:ABC transporter substrate-binding protein [Myxococcota bacterium]